MEQVRREVNLLELKPRRNAEWEETDDGKIVVLVPKFRNPFLSRWLMPLLSKPFFRVRLDEQGSYIWSHCDGQTTVGEIVEGMKSRFGESPEEVEERMNKFIHTLERGELIART